MPFNHGGGVCKNNYIALVVGSIMNFSHGSVKNSNKFAMYISKGNIVCFDLEALQSNTTSLNGDDVNV